MRTGDIIAVLLGCPHPIVLRPIPPTGSGADTSPVYRVIGSAFVNGLMESQAIHGRVPAPWVIRGAWHEGRETLFWYNTETEELSPDLRLGDLPSGWVENQDGTFTDPERVSQEQDPRESVEVIMAKGVRIETFRLV